MKYYLAGRYSRREELLSYAWQLEALGHEVTSRWLRGEHEMPQAASADATDEAFNTMNDDERAAIDRRFAQEDLDDIGACDCLLAFTEPPGKAKGRARGGRHVELGFALAMHRFAGSPVVCVIGWRENVFCCLPSVVHFPTWQSFIIQCGRTHRALPATVLKGNALHADS